jgi:hypothetical protein
MDEREKARQMNGMNLALKCALVTAAVVGSIDFFQIAAIPAAYLAVAIVAIAVLIPVWVNVYFNWKDSE